MNIVGRDDLTKRVRKILMKRHLRRDSIVHAIRYYLNMETGNTARQINPKGYSWKMTGNTDIGEKITVTLFI